MHRALVIALRTLGGLPLLDEVSRWVAEGGAEVHVLVPVAGAGDDAVTVARASLEAERERLAALGATVTGEVVEADPLTAIGDALGRRSFDEVVVCTLPPGLSRWLRDDVVAGVRAVTDLPVRHLTAPAGLPGRMHARAVRLTVHIGESDQYEGRPLTTEIVHRARQAGLAGATVLRGLAGYGASQVVHTARLLSLSEDLPMVVVIVDTAERVEAFLPVLDELVTEGLVVTEEVEVVKYAGRLPS